MRCARSKANPRASHYHEAAIALIDEQVEEFVGAQRRKPSGILKMKKRV